MGKEEFSEKGDGSPSEVHRHHDDADDDNNPSAEEKEEEEEATQRLHSEKEARILDACERRDIEDLQALAQSSGGFLTDELRRQAWPVLLGLPLRIPTSHDDNNNNNKGTAAAAGDETGGDGSWKNLPPHRDEEQVQLDVARAFVYYPDHQSEHDLKLKKTALSNLILSVLRRHPYLHYFQGYHDIAQVFLLVLTPPHHPHHPHNPLPLSPSTSAALARLSLLRIRDFMLPTLSAALSQLRLLPPILRAADPRLWQHLRLAHTEPFFALSGTLTMYAHDVPTLPAITRLFDALLAREPAFGVYLFAALVLRRRAELFAVPAHEPELLHALLSRFPPQSRAQFEALIADTAALFDAYPPETLGAAWDRGVSPHSVLKTARAATLCAGQSEAVGAYYFDQHVLDIARRERREQIVKLLWKYRKPARTVGLAVLVGVLAYWMRRTVFSSSSFSSFFSSSSSSGGVWAPVAALFAKWWPLEV